jgi:hypothetical protein
MSVQLGTRPQDYCTIPCQLFVLNHTCSKRVQTHLFMTIYQTFDNFQMHSKRNASPTINDFLTMSHQNNYDEEIFVPSDLIEEYTKSATPADNFGNGGELSPTLERILIDLKSDPLIGSGTKTDSNRSSPILLHQPVRSMTQKPKQLSIQPVTNSQTLARMDSMEFNKLVQNYLPNGAPSMHTPTNEYPPSRAGNSVGVVDDVDVGNISSSKCLFISFL